jgi:FKBP-type peptidyl-prolyl cis-trans isomerase FkpA/FKBP-type peptidyl-prolyl cis-trans isomerase FklB
MKFYYPGTLGLLVGMLFVSSVGIAADDLKSDQDRMLYFLGTSLSANVKSFALTEGEVDIVLRGMREALAGDALEMDAAVYGEKLTAFAQERMQASAASEAAAADAYIAEMAKEEGAVQTESGIVIVEITAGTGKSASADSTVKAHYHGTLRDGTVFDSSVERGEPLTISLSNVIPCWREGIPTMKEGGKSKITCPSNQAYGDRASGPIPGGSALTFEVELIEVVN